MPTVTRLYLIRHGATMLTAEDRFAGATNVALSNEGRAQAAALADRLKGVKLGAVYASPLDRTMETASILAAPHHLAVQPVDGLREISHGRWEGMTRAEVLAAFPDEVAAWDEDPYTFAPAGARKRSRRDRPRPSATDGHLRCASWWTCRHRFPQSHHPTGDQLHAGIRSAALP